MLPIATLYVFFDLADVNMWIRIVLAIPGGIVSGLLFYELVQLIPIEKAKKNAGVYITVFLAVALVGAILDTVLGGNDVISIIGVNIGFAIIGIMVFNIARAVQDIRAEIGCLLYLVVLMIIGFIVLFTILFFTGALDTVSNAEGQIVL